METSGKQFANFWAWAASKGLMNANTAKTLAAAVRQVLLIEDRWEEVDVSTLDVDNLLVRFRNARARDFKPESLNAYGRRFRQALDLFLSYNRDPGGWRFKGQSESVKRPRASGAAGQAKPEALLVKTAFRPLGEPGPNLIDYPFPLRGDTIVHLQLPVDLKAAEVDRLAAFMRTLAVE